MPAVYPPQTTDLTAVCCGGREGGGGTCAYCMFLELMRIETVVVDTIS